MDDANVYEEAIKVLDEHGWTQGEMGNTVVGFCAIGSLMEASKRIGCYRGEVWDEVKVLHSLLDGKPLLSPVVAQFNDASSTTVEDVKLLLKRAAADDGRDHG